MHPVDIGFVNTRKDNTAESFYWAPRKLASFAMYITLPNVLLYNGVGCDFIAFDDQAARSLQDFHLHQTLTEL